MILKDQIKPMKKFSIILFVFFIPLTTLLAQRQGKVPKNMKEAIVPPIYKPELLDEKLVCSDEDAFDTVRELALQEGLFCGMSSGAATWGALEIAKQLPRGSTVIVLLADRGDRYLSTEVFRSVCALCPP